MKTLATAFAILATVLGAMALRMERPSSVASPAIPSFSALDDHARSLEYGSRDQSVAMLTR